MEFETRKKKINFAAALIVGAILLLSLYSLGRYVRGLIFGFPDPLGLRVSAVASAVPSGTPSFSPSPLPGPSLSRPSAARGASLRGSVPSSSAISAFGARFGEELKFERGASGKVAAIRGAPGQGARASADFSPEDSAQSIARAREVIDAARELIGLEPSLPLGDPTVRTGAVSTQIYFPETLGGVPLEPAGSVIVDLGSQGEILNMTSNYVSGVQVVNHRDLAVDQAKAKAEAVVPEPGSALSTLGGNAIVWVTHTGPGDSPVGYQAYEFNVAGRQVIVDAGSGAVLFKKDRRQF